jgi:lipopolysaccharide transport protein LptA
MNISSGTALFVLLLVSVSNAQTNAPATTNRNIDIQSNELECDLKARVAFHRGNVRVEGQGMQLACESLTAKLPATGSRIESFVAEQKVVFDLVDEKNQKIHGTGDKLVYTYSATGTTTNEIVELTGSPRLETAQGVLTGDLITYDRLNSKLTVSPAKMRFQPEAVGATNVLDAIAPAYMPGRSP